jgi:TetR/AcrR family transcriptional repressor of nem operon
VEAEAFMATVHGAMLSARAYGDPKIFGVILAPVLQRLSAPQNQQV